MNADDKTLQDAVLALERQEAVLLESLKKIEDQLVRVRAARTSLTSLRNEDPLPFDGNLATAIRVVLYQADGPLKPVHVRDAVKNLGYLFKEDQNQMAAVHGVLKRLEASGEVKTRAWRKESG